MSMTTEELAYIQWEYSESKRIKTDHLHPHLRRIMEEYRTNSWNDVADQMQTYVENYDESEAEKMDGRVHTLNVSVRKMAALLSSKQPDAWAKNRAPQDEAIAECLSHRFDALRDEIGYRKLWKRAVTAGLLTGTACFKTSFNSEFVYGQAAFADKPPKNTDESAEEIKVIPVGPMTENNALTIRPDKPGVLLIPIQDIFFDPGTQVLFPEGPARIYHRSMRRLCDVQRDMRYTSKFRKEAKGTWPNNIDEETYPTQEGWNDRRSDIKRVEVVECFDVASSQYCVFSPDCEYEAIDWTPLPFKKITNPYDFLQFIPDPESPYGIPWASLIVSQSRALNFTRQLYLDNVARDGKIVTLYDSTRVDQQTQVLLQNARNGAWVGMPNMASTDDPDKLFRQFELGKINPQLINLQNMFWQDLNWQTGLTDAARNVSGGDQTASEFMGRQQEQNITIEDMRDESEQTQQSVCQKLFRIMLEKWPAKEMVKVMGTDPMTYFYVELERERVNGDFTLEIVVGSSDKAATLSDVKQAMELANVLLAIGQRIDQQQMVTMQTGQPPIMDYTEIARMVMDKVDPKWKDRIMRRRDPVQLMMRLINQYNLTPQQASPAMEMAVQQATMQSKIRTDMMGQQGGMMALPGAQSPQGTIPEQTGVPGPSTVEPMGIQMAQPAGINGRMASEALS